MSRYFDELESELRAAVPRQAGVRSSARAPGHVRPGRRGRVRVRLGTVGLVTAVAVPVVVVALAVILLGHRHGPRTSPGAPRAGAQVTTLAQLRANFALLRRPQTAADRSWRPDYGSPAPRELRGLERLARRLPGGRRVFVTVDASAGGYALRLWIVLADGDATGSSFTAADGYTVLPIPVPAPGQGGTSWTSLVPDGVSGVLWTFKCRQGPCSGVAATDADTGVRDNVAVAQVRTPAGCGGGAGCRRPTRAVWFNSVSRIVGTFSDTTRLTAPPFPSPSLGLGRDQIAGVRFGARRAAAERALTALLGSPPSRAPATSGGCGAGEQLVWPIVIDPASGRVVRAVQTTLFFARGRLVGYRSSGNVELHERSTSAGAVGC